MSYGFKNNSGEYIKIAGKGGSEDTTWVGTQEELETSLPTIPEGTKIIVTDDYDEDEKIGVGFIDLSNKIATFTGSCDWTATENCYIHLTTFSSESTGSTRVYVDGIELYNLTAINTTIAGCITMPIEKGRVIQVVTNPQYIINFYGMKY